MSESILNSVKKILGVSEEMDVFDFDILTHINSAFATLNQLGVGPEAGFMIEDATATWDDFYTDPRFNSVRTYVYLRVRLLHDPPTTSYLIGATEKQLEEFGWRLQTLQECISWTPPPTSKPPTQLVLDGGAP